MFKSIVKSILNSAIAREIINELFKKFVAWLAKNYRDKHPAQAEKDFAAKLEEYLMSIEVEDFMKVKDDAQIAFIASHFQAKKNNIA